MATKQLLEERGESVIGVGIRDADVLVDLTAPRDRERMVEEVEARSGGSIDTIIAVAGLAAPAPATAAVNYFGIVATLDGLRPLLAGSDSPRAVGVGSFASIGPRAEDEPAALARAAVLTQTPDS